MRKQIFLAVIASSLSLSPAMWAGAIPYPSTGIIAPTVPTYATSSGAINVYFAGSGAAFNDSVEIYDPSTGFNSGAILPNHSSTVGQEVVVGAAPGDINAGDQLIFYIVSPENPEGGSGNTLYASIPSYSADGVNHAYITMYDGTGLGSGIPAGIYVGLEDEPSGLSDFNYDDDTFVFTGVSAPSVGATPEPGSLLLLGTGLLSSVLLMRRRLSAH